MYVMNIIENSQNVQTGNEKKHQKSQSSDCYTHTVLNMYLHLQYICIPVLYNEEPI